MDEETSHLAELLKEKRYLTNFPNFFIHIERLLDQEINKTRLCLLNSKSKKSDDFSLPEQEGPVVSLTEKVFIPVKQYPEFNFVGRILGPRGMTAKQLEHETCCRIMIRGKSSMRDRIKEEQNRGKPNWEHLNEELHVLISVEDTRERAAIKLRRAVKEIKKLLIPSAEGDDELKKLQLMELAILNGTYREDNKAKTPEKSNSVDSQYLVPQFYCPPNPSVGVMGYFANPFLTPNDIPALFYVDPYASISGSAYLETAVPSQEMDTPENKHN